MWESKLIGDNFSELIYRLIYAAKHFSIFSNSGEWRSQSSINKTWRQEPSKVYTHRLWQTQCWCNRCQGFSIFHQEAAFRTSLMSTEKVCWIGDVDLRGSINTWCKQIHVVFPKFHINFYHICLVRNPVHPHSLLSQDRIVAVFPLISSDSVSFQLPWPAFNDCSLRGIPSASSNKSAKKGKGVLRTFNLIPFHNSPLVSSSFVVSETLYPSVEAGWARFVFFVDWRSFSTSLRVF